jgi:anti-sigma regulatory factor (Ser/Thr protein kinase)
MVYNKEEFDFGQLLADTVDSMQRTADRHQIELQSHCNVLYRGDQHRIEQVLINLLNNAIKYSPQADKIEMSCGLENGNIVVSVRDFGIGIEQQHLRGLFDRFYRVDNSSARFQGLGLGLFISNEIVKRHGGSFWIESEPDKGSTFYFLLPLNGTQHYTDIATDNQIFYEGSFIKITYRPEGRYMDVDWLGYQNYESVVKGCEIMLDLMRKNNCSLVLNDNTHVKGNWSEASDWGAEVWFPAMAEAGLKKFAWIYSPSTFSRIAANKSLPSEYDVVQLAFFDDKEVAFEWLMK